MALTENDFNGKDLKSQKSGYVLFFADWCGHCKQLKPIWEQLANTKTHYLVAAVDCTSGNKDLMSKFEITGFPTIYVFKNGKYAGDYDGGRSLEDLKNYADKNFDMPKNPPPPPEKEEETKGNFLLWILLILAIVAVVLYYWFYLRK